MGLSRVQLAAALIEYDNDSPYTEERRFAKDSAILSGGGGGAGPGGPPSIGETTRSVMSSSDRQRRYCDEDKDDEDDGQNDRHQVQPSHDFRRSKSPFLDDLPPSNAPTSAGLARPSTSIYSPTHPSHALPEAQTVPLARPTPQKISHKSHKSIAASLIDPSALLNEQDDSSRQAVPAPPPAMIPPRPHSTQPLNSSPLAGASDFGPRRPPPPSDDLFGVPVFPTSPTPASPTSKSRRRSFLNALNFGSKPTSPPPPPDPIGPLTDILRQSIAALPRSLGGDSITMTHHGRRARTASMGDWEGLVLAHGGEAEPVYEGSIRHFGGGGANGSIGSRKSSFMAFPNQSSQSRPESVLNPYPLSSQPSLVDPRLALRQEAEKRDGVDDDVIEFEGVGVVGSSIGRREMGGRKAERLLMAEKEMPAEDGFTAEVADAAGVALPPTPSTEEKEEILLAYDRPQEPEETSWEDVARPESMTTPANDDPTRRNSTSSSFSLLTRTNGTAFSTLDLPPIDSAAQSSAGDYNDRTSPFPDMSRRSTTYSLPPATGPSPTESAFRRLDLDGNEIHRTSAEHEREGSLFDAIGRATPDLLSARREGESDEAYYGRKQKMDEDEDEEEIMLERERWIPPPSQGRASRFDPKSQQARPASSLSMLSRGGIDSLEPDAPVDTRRLPGKKGQQQAKARETSLAHYNQTHRLATTPTSSIYLPPVLVMPAPLGSPSFNRPLGATPSIGGGSSIRSGFFALDSKPIPSGESLRPSLGHRKSSSRSSFIAAASALDIPGKRLTLAQKTFRASLVVDGKRGKEFLGGALEEGERGWEWKDEEEDVLDAERRIERGEQEYRGPGALYGRSLMEVLEERKAALKAKQRTFQGDNRPAMFTRSKSNNSLASNARPVSMLDVRLNPTFPEPVPMDPSGENPARPGTMLNPQGGLQPPQMNRARASVFGIDKLWEKETREREEAERLEAEAERLRLEEEERRGATPKKGGKGWGLGGKRNSKMLLSPNKASSQHPQQSSLPFVNTSADPDAVAEQAATIPLPDSPTKSFLSPTASQLPQVSLSLGNFASSNSIELLARPESDSDVDTDTDRPSRPQDRKGKGKAKKPRASAESAGLGIGGWFASSDEDEVSDGEGGKTTKGEKRRSKESAARSRSSLGGAGGGMPAIRRREDASDSSSDDEIPLSQAFPKGAVSLRSKQAYQQEQDDDESSEEELPLAELLKQKRANNLPPTNATTLSLNLKIPTNTLLPISPIDPSASDEDDVPLGLRHPNPVSPNPNANADDDVPLGLSQAQHLQQMYYLQQQQQHAAAMHMQQQQQQMMMMSGYGPGLMGGMPMGMGMGGIPMGGMGMMAGLGGGGPPMMGGPRPEDKVDRWRRDISTDQ